ncbi:MAG: hypothetical protein Q4D62_06950 [Planctomycetia bacterium]|nr:hypothetical protein [Planctomycetia bacterium]
MWKRRIPAILLLGTSLLNLGQAQEETTCLLQSQAALQTQNPYAVPIPAPLPMGSDVPVPPQRYILLRNEEVLYGIVSEEGENYRISMEGGRIAIPRTQVEWIAPTLQEIYAVKTKKIYLQDVDSRCTLIQWCLKNELYAEAQREIEYLEQIMPQHPRIEVFHRRLAALQTLSASSPQTAPTTPATGNFVATQGPTASELEQMANSIPDDAIEMYRRKIQPIFLRNCMEIGCHGPDATNDFRLLRPSSTMTRSALLRNIHTTLKQVNLIHPEASPLLRKPVTPHGKEGRYIFANRDYATYQLLIAWTYLVAQNKYVLPREKMFPGVKPIPVFSPTPHGLERTARITLENSVVPMVGVHPSLFPQALYPDQYAPPSPPATPQIVMPRPKVELKLDTESSQVVPASGEVPAGEAEKTVRRVSAEEEVPLDWEQIQTYIREPKIYAPGESSAEIQPVDPQEGIAPAPLPNFTPKSPMELLLETNEGIEEHTDVSGEFYYQPETPEKRKPVGQASGSNLLWKQMLEMQKVLDNEGKKGEKTTP